jgi:very-short-patch-repair endonuclease
MIFTSFGPSMIDLSRTSARAVEDLRHFIEFAEQGPKAIAAAVHGSLGGYESPFEAFVADGLRCKGWNTHPQIGVSRFRIDLGVVHPDRPGDYLVGIECDGATYHSAATARDRDKIRAEILRGLGWRLLRVWSTEWWVDRDGALERLDEAIREVLEESRAQAAELERTSDAGTAISASADCEIRDPRGHAEDALPVDAAVPIGGQVPNGEVPEPVPLQRVARARNELPTVPMRRIYRKADLSSFGTALRPNDFRDRAYDATLADLVRTVVEAEAPILDKALVDRIARAHGFKRSGHLIRDRVLEIARRHYFFQPDVDPDVGAFIWLSPDDPDRWNTFRVPEGEDDVRFVDEIPREELLSAARSVEIGDSPSDVAKAFGIRRLSSTTRARIIEATQVQVTD